MNENLLKGNRVLSFDEKRKMMTVVKITSILMLLLGRYILSPLVSSTANKRKPRRLRQGRAELVLCESGNTYYVEREGAADLPVLVFIHGLNSDSTQWFYQRFFFRRAYHLVFIDLPGHGRSPSAVDLSIRTLASDLHEMLLTLRIERPYLYGHSMGANVVLEYSGRGAAKIGLSGIIIHQCSYTNPLRTCLGARLFTALESPVILPFLDFVMRYSKILWVISFIQYLSGYTCLLFRYLFFSGKQSSEELLFISRLAVGCSPRTAACGLLALMKFEARAYLTTISCPTLVLGGEKDRLVRPHASSFIAEQINGAKVVLLREGHQDLIESPDALNYAVQKFIVESSSQGMKADEARN